MTNPSMKKASVTTVEQKKMSVQNINVGLNKKGETNGFNKF